MRKFHEKSNLAQFLGDVYSRNETSGVWTRPNYGGIAYSDGDFAEEKILSILENTRDLSVLSSELRQHCTDWPSLYHLSTSRANILRPLKQKLTGDVLEIGAGCGAITRYLGESGANILALEGSVRRATIARERTRDLENVVLLAERFADFEIGHKFDVITLIGVLEYANLFTDASNPHLSMLQKVRKLLKPEGTLIVAIENQLGLKYFSGANEDHVGLPMFGIEGRYNSKTARTFGRQELSKLLSNAGFPVYQFLACFPDYKLPSSIVTSSGFANSNFDASALASQSVSKDHLKPDHFCFAPELAWPTIINNGLGMDLANSFLLSAGASDEVKIDDEILAYHFSSDRFSMFAKETLFRADATGRISISYKELLRDAAPLPCTTELGSDFLKFSVPSQTAYSNGRPFYADFLRLISNDRWTHDALRAYLLNYLEALEKLGGFSDKLSTNSHINGRYIDCIPSNLIRTERGPIEFVDTEWVVSGEIPIQRVVFRGLMNLIFMPSNFTPDEFGKRYTYGELFKLCFRLIDFDVEDSKLHELFMEELNLQKAVNGHTSSEEQIEKLLKAPLPDTKYFNLIHTYRKQVEELANNNSKLTAAIADYPARITNLSGQLAAASHELQSIKLSRKWRWAVKLSELTPKFIKSFFRQVSP